MSTIYHALIYNPLLNLLVFFYKTIAFEDLGLAIIFLTLLIRLILFPLFQKSVRYQKAMQIVQPKIQEAQKKHASDRVKQTETIMAIYKEHNLNPFSGFLFLLIQLPILIGLYRIFYKILTPSGLQGLYSFITAPQSLNPMFLGLLNLSKSSMLMVVLTAIAQYFQGKMLLAKNNKSQKDLTTAERVNKQMVFLGPVITLLIFSKLPAALSLYWLVTTLFSIGQQVLVNRQFKHELDTVSQRNN